MNVPPPVGGRDPRRGLSLPGPERGGDLVHALADREVREDPTSGE